MTITHQGGRRAATEPQTSRPPTTLILAVALPVVAVLAMLVARGGPVPAPDPVPPEDSPLTSLQLVCPAALSSSGDPVSVATVGETRGEVAVRDGARAAQVSVAPGRVASARARAAVTVDGRDALAPGLVAGRADERERAATACREPLPVYWFTGLGAGSLHASELELANPDDGPAVADITVYGPDGLVDNEDIRGLTVPGRDSTSIDLSKVAPSRDTLAIRIAVVRGRLGASVVDRVRGDVTSSRTSADWLPPQAQPATENLMLGLPGGTGDRRLVVLNPSPDEALVDVKLVGATSTFSSTEIEGFSVPPQSVVVRDLGAALGGELKRADVGVQVTANVPVTADLASVVEGDLSHAVPSAPFGSAAVLLPDAGRAELMVAGPEVAGSVEVTAWSRSGRKLLTKRVAAQQLTSATLALPARTALVTTTPDQDEPTLLGAVRVDLGSGWVTLPLRQLVLTGLVPAVRPGLDSPRPVGQGPVGQASGS